MITGFRIIVITVFFSNCLHSINVNANHVQSIRLFSEPRLSQEVGKIVAFMPILSTVDNLEFQYRITLPGDEFAFVARDWGDVNFDWDTTNFQTGTYLIQLRARHIGTTIPLIS